MEISSIPPLLSSLLLSLLHLNHCVEFYFQLSSLPPLLTHLTLSDSNYDLPEKCFFPPSITHLKLDLPVYTLVLPPNLIHLWLLDIEPIMCSIFGDLTFRKEFPPSLQYLEIQSKSDSVYSLVGCDHPSNNQ